MMKDKFANKIKDRSTGISFSILLIIILLSAGIAAFIYS